MANVSQSLGRGIALLPLVVMLCASPASASPSGQEGTVRVDGPYTESWAQMVSNHAQWQRDIASGKIPAPPQTMVMHEQGDEFDRSGPEVAIDQIPAAFKPQGPGTRDKGVVVRQAPQPVTLGFVGLSSLDTIALGLNWIPPDTNGAIGLNHFVELVNGGIGIYDRLGTKVSAITDQAFFHMVIGDVTYPRNGSYDPRIIYDRRAGRWFACELEFGATYNAAGDTDNNHYLLAVSRTSDPTGVWDKYIVYIGLPVASGVHYFTDYETLGTDSNGLYFSARYFPTSGSSFVRLFATRKASLVSATPGMDTVYYMGDAMSVHGTPHPALSHDAVAAGGLSWFASSSSLAYSGLWLRSVSWPATGAPTWGAQQLLATPVFGNTPTAPANGSSTNIGTGGVRLQNAVIMNNQLWASRNVGTNSVGGSSSVDRCAVEYLVVDVSSATASLVQSGRKYDSAATSPLFFFYPSITPTGTGAAAMGFSDSNGSRYVTAATAGRLPGDAAGTLQAVTTLQDGLNNYTSLDSGGTNRWGDYSFTSLDPRNNQAVWTIQEYALGTANRWGTYIAKLGGLPPFIISYKGLLLRGVLGAKITVTGGNFYDPGQEFPDRIGAYFYDRLQSGGLTVTGIDVTDPTQVVLTVDVDAKAPLGGRTLRITNPDGQYDLYSAGVGVQAPTKLTLAASGGQRGQTITASATLLESDTGAAAPGQTVNVYLDGVLQGAGMTDANGVARATFTIPNSVSSTPSFTADFAQTSQYLGSSATAKFTVKLNTTGLYVAAPVATAAGAYIRIYAYLKRTIDGKMLPNQTVSFTFAGVAAGSAITDANGYAQVLYLIPPTTPAGVTNIGAAFAGDAQNLSCTGSGSATVNAGTATSIFSNSATGSIGTRVQLYAYLWRSSDHAMLVGRTVEFSIDGVYVGSCSTDANGYGLLVWQVPQGFPAGTHTLYALFRGDATFKAVGRQTTLTTSSKVAVTLSCGKASGVRGLPVKLYGYLTRTLDGALMGNRTVTFSIDGAAVGSATTDTNGYAYLMYTIPAGTAASSAKITDAYAGDDVFDPGAGANTLLIAAKDTIAWYVPSLSAVKGGRVVLYAYLKSVATGLPIMGRQVTFKVDGTAVGSGVSASNGYVSCVYVVPVATQSGAHTLMADFAGDAVYFAGSKSATLTIQ